MYLYTKILTDRLQTGFRELSLPGLQRCVASAVPGGGGDNLCAGSHSSFLSPLAAIQLSHCHIHPQTPAQPSLHKGCELELETKVKRRFANISQSLEQTLTHGKLK